MKRPFTVLVLFIILLMSGVGCAKQEGGTPLPAKEGAPAQKKQEKIIMRYTGSLPLDHYITESQNLFKKLVEERAKGRVEIQLYPASQLYGDKDMTKVLPAGGVELTNLVVPIWTGLVPSVGLTNIGYLMLSREEMYKVLDGPPGQEVIKDLEEVGNCKFLGWLDFEEGCIFLSKPIKSLDELKGLRMRCVADYDAVTLMAFGVSPVTISNTETYQALQRGTADGLVTGPGSYVTRKLSEVCKYPVKFEFGQGIYLIAANRDFWDKVPADIQNIMLESAKEVTQWIRKKSQEDEEMWWKQIESTPGVNVIRLSDGDLKRLHEAAREEGDKVLAKRVGEERMKQLTKMVDEVLKR